MDTSPPTRLRSACRRWSAAAVAVAVCAGLVGWEAGAAAQGDGAAAARTTLEEARAARRHAEARLAGLEEQRDQARGQLERLGEQDAMLTTELADARRQVREYAVAAYIDGGQSELLRSTLTPEQAAALAWRTGVVAGSATAAVDAVDRYDALRNANDPERLAAAVELDRLQTEVAEAFDAAIQAAAHERDAEVLVAEVDRRAAEEAARAQAAVRRQQEQAAQQAAARARSAVRQPAAPRTTSAPAAAPVAVAVPEAPPAGGPAGNPTPAELATLARIRRCESGGNYSIVSSTGRYRGAYQFDTRTWQSVGGTGDPAAASPAEQDYRALLLLRQRGTRPWPHCGR